MDQDDPEKRIADFERQLANASGGTDQELQRFPGQSPAPTPRSRRQRRAGGIRDRLFAIWKIVLFGSIAVGAVMVLGSALHNVYAYQVGTPTTATVDHCTPRYRGPSSCTATWSIGGTSSSGPIVGLKGSPMPGQKEQARVHAGTAYTGGAWNVTSLPVWWFLGAIALGVVIFFVNRLSPSAARRPPGERPGS